MQDSNQYFLENGEICDSCGTPVFFYGEAEVDCPNCGQTYALLATS